MTCEHKFLEQGFGQSDGRDAQGFVGVDLVRTCELCDHVEVLVGGDWLAFDDYIGVTFKAGSDRRNVSESRTGASRSAIATDSATG